VRALILRRVALIEAGASGPVLIGQPQSAGVVRLQSFLNRNGEPTTSSTSPKTPAPPR
jgi:thioredoxin reductase (NADPH)